MFLHIDDSMTIAEVQERFTDCFPYLAIAFYSAEHKRFAPSENQFLYLGHQRIGNIRKNHNNGALEIKSWHSVSKVEKELKDIYGLNAQVFRVGDDGKNVQTTLSDELTLKEQSDLAADTSLNHGPAV